MLAAAAATLAGGAGAGLGQDRAPAACLRARIGGQVQCLTAHLACRPRFEHLYLLYGYTCRLDAASHYRLRERLYIGPPLPSADR